ncbi:MAG: XdhC family protein [Pseudomonadota bacterium]
MDTALLSCLNAARDKRQAAIVVKDLKGGADQLLLQGDAIPDGFESETILRAFRSGKSGMVETRAGSRFLSVHVPSPRLVVIGAVHISQVLAPMAQMAGLHVTVIDPRAAFATAERFPATTVHAEWPQDILPTVGLDGYTALAALTHDPKIDDPGLMAAFEAGCFYIGALGSRKTHATRVARLEAGGVAANDLARVAAPIGLDIGAASPAEIAVAVLAEIIAALRGPKHVVA